MSRSGPAVTRTNGTDAYARKARRSHPTALRQAGLPEFPHRRVRSLPRSSAIESRQPGRPSRDRREVIMTMSEYEERFRSPLPSLYQISAAARGAYRGRRRGRYFWVAAALVGVMTMMDQLAAPHTIHSGKDSRGKCEILAARLPIGRDLSSRRGGRLNAGGEKQEGQNESGAWAVPTAASGRDRNPAAIAYEVRFRRSAEARETRRELLLSADSGHCPNPIEPRGSALAVIRQCCAHHPEREQHGGRRRSRYDPPGNSVPTRSANESGA